MGRGIEEDGVHRVEIHVENVESRTHLEAIYSELRWSFLLPSSVIYVNYKRRSISDVVKYVCV
jgi:hypothetical protein